MFNDFSTHSRAPTSSYDTVNKENRAVGGCPECRMMQEDTI